MRFAVQLIPTFFHTLTRFEFQAEFTVTIVDPSKVKIASIFSCTRILQPIRYFTAFNEKLLKNVNPRSIKTYQTHHGYVFKGSLDDANDLFYPNMSRYNPLAKILIITDEASRLEVRENLESGYKNFKILNNAILILNNSSSSICVYDPFYRHPKLKCWNITSQNYKEIVAQIRKFSDMRIRYLQGFKLNVYMFNVPMTSLGIYNPDGSFSHYKYRDGEIIQIFSKLMDFRPNYIQPRDGSTFGYQLPNGKFVGNLAAIEYNLVDLLGNSRLIEEYFTMNSIFLHPIESQKLVFFIQKFDSFKDMKISLFFMLDALTISICVGLLVVFPIIYYLTYNFEAHHKPINNNGKKIRKISFMRSLLFTFGLTNNIVFVHPPHLTSSRTIYTVILFYALVFTAVCQSNILNNIYSTQKVVEIKTLNQLFSSDFSFQYSNEVKSITAKALIFQNLTINNSTNPYPQSSKIAVLYPKNIAIDLIGKLEAFGKDQYTIVPESPYEFYVSMMTPKNSPFQKRFNEIINRIVESGIIKYQDMLAHIDFEKYLINRVKRGFVSESGQKVLELDDLLSVFALYLVMNTIAIVIIILEVSLHPTHRITEKFFMKMFVKVQNLKLVGSKNASKVR